MRHFQKKACEHLFNSGSSEEQFYINFLENVKHEFNFEIYFNERVEMDNQPFEIFVYKVQTWKNVTPYHESLWEYIKIKYILCFQKFCVYNL